jgi:predicted deacetylase
MIASAAGRVPVSLLVVPRYHGTGGWDHASRRWLLDAAGDGDEIVLHGYEHRSPDGFDGAEFGRCMPHVAAAARLDMAMRGLAELGLRADGFIAPAYAHPPALTAALRARRLNWWATRTRLHGDGSSRCLWGVGLGASTAWRRITSPAAARSALRLARPLAAVRLDLHPADLAHSGLRHAATALICALLADDRYVTTHAALLATPCAPARARRR